MENIYLKDLAKKGILSVTDPQFRDKDAPFSFLEWKQRRLNYPEQDIYFYYQQYLVDWFENNKNKPLNQTFVLKQKYLYLLQQLQAFFTEEEKQQWYSKINLNDDRELLISIPFFAEKLKTISLYYLNSRKKLKNLKIKYNHVGTTPSIEKEVGMYLLENYTTLNNELLPSIKAKLPNFETIKDSFQVKVEELYDDFNYADRANNSPLSASYDLLNAATSRLFQTKGLTLSSDSWVFSSLNAMNLGDYETYINQLTANVFETTDFNTYKALLENLLSETKISTTFTQSSAETEIFDVNILSGNNIFYYPYGDVYEKDLYNESITNYIPVALSSLDIAGSTAGNSLSSADVLFIKTGNAIKGAWLKYIDFVQETKPLIAKIKENSNTRFVFPFPGYGLSAENVDWTGYSLSATNEYEFLSKKYKQSVDYTYWVSDLPQDQCEEIYINNTTLSENGSIANKNSNFSDQIYKYNFKPTIDQFPLELNEGAWLYRFDKTSIPIAFGFENVPLVWPYGHVVESFDPLTNEPIVPNEYPEHLTKLNYLDVCNFTAVSSLNVPFAIASDNFQTAEKIYKLKNYKDSIENATECCWLSGKLVDGGQSLWIDQEGFSTLFQPGTTTRFIWTGTNNTPLSSVFSFINHSIGCQVVTNQLINQPENCTCKQVFYSPFGHPGETYYSSDAESDYIVLYTAQPDETFDLQTALRGTNKFAWFKTNSSHPDWGNGKWVFGLNNSSASFNLETGKSYVYYRSTNKQDKIYPPYVVNYKFAPKTQKPKWIQAKKNANGEWISSGEEATTILNAGDLLKWNKPNTINTFYLSSYNVLNESTPLSSIWSSNQIVALGKRGGIANSTYISWPLTILDTSIADPQIPQTSDGEVISFDRIETILEWTLTHVETNSAVTIANVPNFTFTPQVTGTYNITVVAQYRMPSLSASTEVTTISSTAPGGTTTVAVVSGLVPSYKLETIIFWGIPPIYVIPEFRTEYTYVSSERQTSGYLLEQQLYGWNYSNNTKDVNGVGAKPYWADLYLDKFESTRYKGLMSWGYPEEYISGYIPNFTPKISKLTLQYGNTIDYNHKGIGFLWNQPITYKTFTDETMWCKLSSDITGGSPLSSFYEIKNENEPLVAATSEPSDISLANFINGYPVELHYYAENEFVWSISATSLVTNSQTVTSTYLEGLNPYFANRFNSSIATVPIAQSVYSTEETGGYFTPQNLGASQYINQNFTPFISAGKYYSLSAITQDPTKYVGGKRFSDIEQKSIYSWTENNQWLKEPYTSNNLAGSTRSNLTKTHQTFVPYKNGFTEKPIGLLNSSSKLTPWGGVNNQEWVDVNNKPISYTGVYNVSAWKNSQFLKNTTYNMEGWVTDVYGNQYGLFKPTSLSASLLTRAQQTGQLWVRTNGQVVQPAFTALSGIVEFYKGNSEFENLYEDLKGTGIINMDCFYDTLMIQTSGALIFTKISYDYETDQIRGSYDNIRNIKIENNQLVGQSWFVTNLKKIITPFVTLSGDCPFVDLYELNLPTFTSLNVKSSILNNVFFQNLSSFKINSITNCTTSYDSDSKQLLITTSCKETLSERPFVFDCLFDIANDYNLLDITTYSSNIHPKTPSVEYSNNFVVNIGTGVKFNLTFQNNPLSAELLNYTNNLTLNPNGLLSGTLPNFGLHFINYSLKNLAGSNTFGITISCIPPITELPVTYINSSSLEEYYLEEPYNFIVSEKQDKDFVICLKTIGKFEVFTDALSAQQPFIRIAWDPYIACNNNKTQLLVGETATLSSISNDLYTFYYLGTGTNNSIITALTYGAANQTNVLTATNTYNQLIN